MSTLANRPFKPSVNPDLDWPTYVRELWDYLLHFSIEGISVNQYVLTIRGHLSYQAWVVIYTNTLKFHVDLKAKITATRTLLFRYTWKCYSFEDRIHDKRRSRSHGNVADYANSVRKYHQQRQYFADQFPKSEYLDLLDIIQAWELEDRGEFLLRQGCINEFLAPKLDKITPEVTRTARLHYKMKLKMGAAKRVCSDEPTPQTVIKKRKAGEDSRVVVSESKCATKINNTRKPSEVGRTGGYL